MKRLRIVFLPVTLTCLLFLICSFFIQVQGETFESKTIVDLIKFSDRDTLVVLDLTHTLMKPIASGVKLVEPMTSEVIHRLQEEEVMLVGLTARSSKMANETLNQLASIAINLSKSTVCHKEVKLKRKYAAKFVKGIIFAGRRNDKGETLFCLLDSIGFRPTKILFIDDQLKNIRSVKSASEKRQIPFIGLHYLDPPVKSHFLNRDFYEVTAGDTTVGSTPYSWS